MVPAGYPELTQTGYPCSIISTFSPTGYFYILTNRRNGTLYAGVTNNLIRRVYEHRTKAVKGFTKKYGLNRLVYFEQHETALLAIQREKNVKHWPRKWKLDLIEANNLDLIEANNMDWRDLYNEIV